MPVPVQNPEIAYTANGVTTVFAFPFMVFSSIDLRVRVDGALAVLNVDYTVTGVGVESGGNVVFGSAPADGTNVTIQRRMPLGRDIEYQYSGDFQSPTVNRDFDRLWMGVQDINQDGERALRLPVGDTASTILPTQADRALRGMAFDANGNAVAAPASDASSLGVKLADNATGDNGAGLVGFNAANDYPDDTVGKALAGIASTADASKGAALVGYKLDATGAVGRALSSRLEDVVSVKDFGAVGDGVANDTAAFLAAFAHASTHNRVIYIPAGTYEVAATIGTGTIVRGMYGEGRGVSIVNFAAGVDGFSFAFDDPNEFFSCSDMSIQSHGQSGTALLLDYSARLVGFPGYDTRFRVDNVTFQGATGQQGTGWSYGVDAIGGANSTISNCDFIGFWSDDAHYPVRFPSAGGFRFRGNGPAADNLKPIAIVVDKCWVTHAVIAVQFDGLEGGLLSHCNLIEVDYGVRWTSGDIQRPQLAATDSHINCYVGGIITDGLAQCTIQGNLIYRIHLTAGVATGISLSRTSTNLDSVACTIVGNTFVDSGTEPSSLMDGIVANSCLTGVFDHNIFQRVRNGITLGVNTDSVFVGGGNRAMVVDGTLVSNAGVNNVIELGAAANPGSQGMSSGMIVKYGSQLVLLDASGNGTIPLSPAFPSAAFMAVVNNADPSASGSAAFSVDQLALVTTGIPISVRPNPGAVNVRVAWIAIGK